MNLKICLAQLNPTLGDLEYNTEKALAVVDKSKKRNIDLVVFPEMFISGYQLQDLVLKEKFLSDVKLYLKEMCDKVSEGPAVLIGAPEIENGKIYNSYFCMDHGSISVAARKYHLPNTDIFDERRYFNKGSLAKPIKVLGTNVGTPICEDIWYPDVIEYMVKEGARIIISPNGSPYSRGKVQLRHKLATLRARENKIPLIYLNLVGGQDDQVFDGGSFVVGKNGKILYAMPQFEEATSIFEFNDGIIHNLDGEVTSNIIQNENSQDYRAMCLALEDYVKKSGFSKVLIGLSGGIDSALVTAIAVDALGAENVLCVRLPSVYSSEGSLIDAEAMAEILGCRLDTVAIGDIHEEISRALNPLFEGTKNGLAEENIQARIRGLLLMAVSNKFNYMLLTTGNKSEVAVGYSTIYGDMAGGYNPIKDLYKTRVYNISKWRNENHLSWMQGPEGIVIPNTIINKAPSAELRPDQKDQDSLPPYSLLDAILEGLIEEDLSVEDLVNRGFDKETVKAVESLIYASEHKRYQAAPGVHLTDKSFWLGRRYPIIQKWRDKS
ncbi:MAG: NAD+ synthase [Paracoccaceae bacterium]